MELESDFCTFLEEIRPSANMRDNSKEGHKILRERLNSYEKLQHILVSDFLQGSYRRSTAVRPKNGARSDVDIIVVTKLSESEYTPQEAMSVFEPFLNHFYKDKWKQQGRSFGIELTYVDMDLVITSAPSDAEIGILQSESVKSDDELDNVIDWRLNPSWLSLQSRSQIFNAKALLEKASQQDEWKLNPLRIPDRDAGFWEDTHPLEQIRWTRDKNKNTNKHFVNVVKAIKWWWLEQFETLIPPKGFPLERLIGECCPDGITSVAEGIMKTFNMIKTKYATYYQLQLKPELPDYGVPSHDVFKRITTSQFSTFYEYSETAVDLSSRAYYSTDRAESGQLWRELLGNKFPEPPSTNGSKNSGYTHPVSPAIPSSSRFA